MLRRHLLLATSALALSACGFRLKGTGSPIVVDAPVRLQAPSSERETIAAVAAVFAARGIAFEPTVQSGYEIVLDEFVNHRFESAVGGQYGQSRVLDVRMGFTATLRKDGQILARQDLASERSLNYHSEQYLGSVADDEEAQRAMRRENAEKLLRFFQATLGKP